jgi:hypothetical protein
MKIKNTVTTVRYWYSLPSVGSALNKNGLIYPLNKDGVPNEVSGVELDDASDEWFSALSDADAALVNKFKEAR